MSGWGRISFLIGAGVLLGAGCGGRTGALEGDFGDGADGGALSQGGSSAGRSTRGGATTGGTRSVGGAVTQGGYPTAGTGPYPVGGFATAGTGPYPVGGYGYGGYGYGGYSCGGDGCGFGGAYPVAGTFGFGGTFSVGGDINIAGSYPGGYGGQGPQACGTCLLQSCSAPLVTCLQDYGCLSIFNCMQASGCQAFQCYSDQYCKGTIDQWGGPAGQPMRELLSTFTCAVQAGCPCN